jgi:hypothetical protein
MIPIKAHLGDQIDQILRRIDVTSCGESLASLPVTGMHKAFAINPSLMGAERLV